MVFVMAVSASAVPGGMAPATKELQSHTGGAVKHASSRHACGWWGTAQRMLGAHAGGAGAWHGLGSRPVEP